LPVRRSERRADLVSRTRPVRSRRRAPIFPSSSKRQDASPRSSRSRCKSS